MWQSLCQVGGSVVGVVSKQHGKLGTLLLPGAGLPQVCRGIWGPDGLAGVEGLRVIPFSTPAGATLIISLLLFGYLCNIFAGKTAKYFPAPLY